MKVAYVVLVSWLLAICIVAGAGSQQEKRGAVRPSFPAEIKVGAVMFQIKYTESRHCGDLKGGPYEGCTYRFDHVITIRRGLDLREEREVLLHEVEHAAFMLSSTEDEVALRDTNLKKWNRAEREEFFVTLSAPVFYRILSENPNLVRYLFPNESRELPDAPCTFPHSDGCINPTVKDK